MQTEVQSWGRFLVEAVRSWAEKNDVAFETLSGDWIMRLEKGGLTHYLFGNDFGLNNTATRAICNDKSATYQVLTREGIPALEHRLLLRPGSLGAPAEGVFFTARQASADFSEQVVCKPNSASSGADVVFAHSPSELETALLDLFPKYRAITLSPFVAIRAEYRICVLHNTIELLYAKKRQEGALQHNLSHGATAHEVMDATLIKQLSQMALQVAHVLNGAFVHVDIIDVAGELMVLEVNSGIMFEHYVEQSDENRARASAIYHKALDSLWQNAA